MAAAAPQVIFEAGSWIWCPHDKEMFLPAKVTKTFKQGEAGGATFEDGKAVALSVEQSKQALPMDEAALITYDNMIKLNDLNEPTILHNLRQRFLGDKIYTYVSSILVACNPFKLLPIYTPEIMDKYKDGGGREQPPHIYAISDNAYRNLMESFRDQAVVISGESGAGKTETMKLVLQFLADVSGRASKSAANGEKTESLEQQILKSNPVMEAFGNAKTTRNNNSSRFGKWTEIKFNRAGTIVGGSIINYLLEKSRIPFQAQQERNYHIFYQLLAGAELDLVMKKSYKLRDAEDFRYMNQSGVTTVDTINDEKDWLEMTGAMDVLNMTAAEKESVFRLIAAILHLGNVEFDKDPKGTEDTAAKVKNPEQLAIASELLKVDNALFSKSLCFRKISSPGKKSCVYAQYSIAKANDARDATTKALYGKLFDWLISKINAALSGFLADSGSKEKLATIGVLDIFGFESFATNSFEQLCINYCNEKLQFHFNEYIFKLEQEEYRSEGVPVDMIEFKDNQPTLDLLEARSVGIFAMIDEEINVPKGSDETLLKKVLVKHAKHPNFAAPKPKDLNANLVFVVQHYAGAVPYNVTSFLEKNKDALNDDITECVNASKCGLICKLLSVEDTATALGGGGAGARPGPKKKQTLGGQFKSSLEGLMSSLYKCEPHFVRCMKSNHQKKGGVFESDMMMAQLRYAGLLEVCRIRKIGFPVRKKFDEFLFRYRCLDLTAAKDHKTLCASLEKKGMLEPRQWVIGHTKIFMRNLQQTKLEEAREVSLKGVVRKMQAAARRYVSRCRFARYKKILKSLQEAIGKRTEEALEAALSEVVELPFGGAHVPMVKQARQLKERLEEERRITTACTEAIKNRDLAELRSAVKAAQDATPPFSSPAVTQAAALRDLMEKERAAVKQLKDACESRSLDAIKAALEAAKPFGGFVVDTDAYKAAVSLKERIEAENAAREVLQKAIAARSYKDISAGLEKMTQLGMQEELMKEAQRLKEELEEQDKALNELKGAMAERVLDTVQNALRRCKKVGLADEHPSVKAGKELEARLLEEKAIDEELTAAADSRDAGKIEAGLKKAEKAGMTDCNGYKKASKMLERLRAEAEAVEGLKAALKANKAPAILAAINKANELGLDCPEMAKAKEAMGKLGAQSEALLKLETAVAAGDIAGLDEALKKVEGMGLGEEDVVKAAREAKGKILKQNACAEQLEKALAAASSNKEGLKAALEAAEALDLAKRYGSLVEKAAAALASLDKEEGLLKALRTAVDNEDEEGVEAVASKAAAAGAAVAEAMAGKLKEAKADITARKDLMKRLAAALEPEEKDKELLEALLTEAAEKNIKNAKVDQAKQLMSRDKNLKELKKALKKALKNGDEKALAAALDAAMQQGLEDLEEVKEAKQKKKQLEEEKELASDLRAAMKDMSAKAETKGVTNSDLKALKNAIEGARAKGLADDSPFMQKALEAHDRIKTVLQFQTEVQEVLNTDYNRKAMKAAKKLLSQAQDMDLEGSSLCKKLRAWVKEATIAASEAAIEGDAEPVPLEEGLDEEAMKKEREERLKKAANPKFHWTRYSKIKSPEDFAKGILLTRKKVMAGQLRWQGSTIPTSMLEFTGKEKDLTKLAVNIHKCILGYTGDKSILFPPTLAQDLLRKGMESPLLVDEIYVQICKHLTHNPRPESVVRGWQLMCMCVGTFPPSPDFENCLINFILEQRHGAGAVGNYARYSLRRLEGILNSGPSGFVPSVDEISAYKDRPPILATIELVDGTPLTEDLPITPDLNVGKVLDICSHFLELSDPRMQYFGIFVEDVEDPAAPKLNPDSEDAPPYAGLPKTPRPLQNENFMGDVVTVKVRQNQPFKFVYKRKIFLRTLDELGEDPMFERLVYLQSIDEVIKGNIPLDSEEEVADLTAKAMAIDLVESGFPEEEGDLLEADLMEYIPRTWRGAQGAEKWAELVLAKRDEVADENPDDLQSAYVRAVKDHPLYGTCFFHVRRHRFPPHMEGYPQDVIIALNSEGLHFLNEDMETLSSFGYADIYRWGGSSTQFSIIIWNPDSQDTDDVSMFTSQAADMAALILDYINAIMATTDQ